MNDRAISKPIEILEFSEDFSELNQQQIDEILSRWQAQRDAGVASELRCMTSNS